MKKITVIIFLIFCFPFVLSNIVSGDEEKTELEIEFERLEAEPTEPRILIERNPLSDYGIYNVTIKIVNQKIVDENCANLSNQLSEIPGIISVKVETYKVTIKKGTAFNWEKIEPKVLKIIKECFGEDKNRVKIIFPEEARSK